MKKLTVLFIIIGIIATLTSCNESNDNTPPAKSTGIIYLYGETHGIEKIMEKEFEKWRDYYRNENMRHLFVELPYYTAEFLNIWIKSDSDDILDELYNDWAGTAMQVPYTKEFYKLIKRDCPETIFIGTDVGHQYDTTGKRYLTYLETNNLKDSEQYLLAQETIEQGKYYYLNSGNDYIYHENKMSENFIREFDMLNNKNIMGIYGTVHTEFGDIHFADSSVPSMAKQLNDYYGESVLQEFLFVINIGGKDYRASYFGEYDISQFGWDYIKREFWRLENAYDDFKDKTIVDNLPYGNYPMTVETGQVFVIDYTKNDGSVEKMYYRSDGTLYRNNPSTVGFKVD